MPGGEPLDPDETSWPNPRFALDRVVIENFRSIARCDVRLDQCR
jgi:hypothetical protein